MYKLKSKNLIKHLTDKLQSKAKLEINSLVKLVFIPNAKNGESRMPERMWVKVTKIDGANFEGRLDNDPVNIPQLNAGDLIVFHRKHIFDIWDD